MVIDYVGGLANECEYVDRGGTVLGWMDWTRLDRIVS